MKFLAYFIPCLFLLSGCAAIGTAVSHRNLEVQSMMSNSIFMMPTADQRRDVFVQVRNTTDKPSLKITVKLVKALRAKGCHIIKNPRYANYILQVNLLQMGKNTETAAKEMMASGYGGALEGAVAGGAIAYVAGGGIVAGGLIGGVAETVADNVIQDVTYSGIVDIRLLQRTTGKKKWHEYKTRILVTANKVNLSFNEARPKIELGLVSSISGLF